MVPPAPPGSRLLVVAPQPFYEDRGTPIAVRHVLEALSELGRPVDLLTYPVGEPFDLPGLRVFRIRNPFGFRTVPIGFSLSKLVLDAMLVPAIFNRLRRERYHAVHAVEEAVFPAILAGRKWRTPVVYDMQSSLPEQLQNHMLFRGSVAQRGLLACERWAIRRSSMVVCSAGLADQVRSVDAGVDVSEWLFPAGASNAPVPSAEEIRAELGLRENERVIVYSGNFASYQGLSTLMDAIPRVVAAVPQARFVLVGSSHLDPALHRQAATLRERGVLRLVPRQPRERIPGYLAIADVLVSPRVNGNNLPLKVFDYMAAGRPIVATDSPTHRRVLDEERACFVGPGAEALAEGITALLLDHHRAARLAMGARAYFDENLGWLGFLRLVASLYPADRSAEEPRAIAAV